MGNDIIRVSCVNENCGTFPMDEALNEKLKRTGETFSCPSGHQQHFTKSTEQKLREKVERLEERAERYQERARDLWEEVREERDRNDELQARLMEAMDATGAVEIREDNWRWRCDCGSCSRTAWGTESKARTMYEQHRENIHGDAGATA